MFMLNFLLNLVLAGAFILEVLIIIALVIGIRVIIKKIKKFLK